MLILTLLFIVVVAEFSYSLYSRDEMYSKESTQVNIFTQAFGVLKDVLIPSLGVIGIISFVNGIVPHVIEIPFTLPALVVCLFLMDFLYYVFHRANHYFGLLWMFHFVHHSDTKLNLSVGFRSSWFEMVGLFATYSILLIIGFPLSLFLVAFTITSTYQFLTHSRYIQIPTYLEYLFVTPLFHAAHHDRSIKYQNSNFGGVFSLWDRFFSTYVKDVKSASFGIEGYSQHNVIKIHTDPILSYLRRKFRALK